MGDPLRIDITFDFRTDTPPGKDPDAYSRTLRQYHKRLWSKRLPSGELFDLDDRTRGAYLHHKSSVGEIVLTSDSVVPTFRKVMSLIPVFRALPNGALESFHRLSYTIGGMMVFPGNKVHGKMTINGARGFNSAIKDRFDLTVECIRRHYAGESSPLGTTLARYDDFFALFRDFSGYVKFFLLQDLVKDGVVRYFTPFKDFYPVDPVPTTPDAYRDYMKLASAFIQARNVRIRSEELDLEG